MSYNFDEIIDRRNTNCLNTDGFRGYIFNAGPEKVFPFKDEEFIRMWVADMEFATPIEIRNAIKERIDKKIFGYTMSFDNSYYTAFNNWCQQMYDWTFPKEELVSSPGIIPALYQLVELLVKPHEQILTFTPAYGFFKHATTYNQVPLISMPLLNTEGYFSIDFKELEHILTTQSIKLFILCNPHNPTGRMWTNKELTKLAELIEKHDLWVISDEIHCDLIRQNKKHIPLGKIMPHYNKLITCMSASKTFNMAGLMLSNIIIRNAELRKEFIARDKTINFINPLSYEAHKAAYEHGKPWLDELKAYLDENFAFVKNFLNSELPKLKITIPESTYLAWVDLNPYLPPNTDVSALFANAGVLLEGGDGLFVDNADNFIRLNLAMPRSIIQEGLKRIVATINNQ